MYDRMQRKETTRPLMIPGGYEIRRAFRKDIAFLPEVERHAGTLFAACPEATGLTDEILACVNSIDSFEQAREDGHLWVAAASTGEVTGFALVLEVGGYAHLDELDVLPSHGQRGLGSALLATVCAWAREAGFPAVTLRTFRDVPWNAPFYQRRGFQVVESSELSEQHAALEVSERLRGLRTDLRVAMRYVSAVAR
jgi:GNAT superfamily N-acetyltransferase